MKRNFPASLDSLHEMLQFVFQESSAMRFDEPIGLQIELAVEEALVNIIKYGYVDQKGNIEIDCKITNGKRFEILIKDTGVYYNPLAVISEAPQETHDVGGYGVFLMTHIMDHVSYQREGDSNVLLLVKEVKVVKKQNPLCNCSKSKKTIKQ